MIRSEGLGFKSHSRYHEDKLKGLSSFLCFVEREPLVRTDAAERAQNKKACYAEPQGEKANCASNLVSPTPATMRINRKVYPLFCVERERLCGVNK